MARILVIDDDKSLREGIAEMLELADYETVTAEDGAMGIQMAQDTLPDLIVCDVMMPGLNGFDVFQTLRSETATAVIPFLFLTARADHDSWRFGMGLGADDYLTKPFIPEVLLETVKTRLEKRDLIKRQAAEHMDELTGNLVAILPHELRTPLNIIMGYADLILMDDPSPDSDLSRMMAFIMKASHRLQHVIENYLLYAQTEIQRHNHQSLEAFAKHRVEMPGTLIQDTVYYAAQRSERENDVSIYTEDQLVRISSDALKKIIEELVDNAFKFSKPGAKVEIIAALQGEHYRIQVSDQGRGMTSEQIDRIRAYMQFERKVFEQQGMGLGLIVAKRLVELYDGKFEVASVPGQGTTVQITLRLVD
jgi:signal transduction histidine kinase